MSLYKNVTFLPLTEFIEMVNSRNPDASNVVTMLYGQDEVSIRVFNDRDPTYWTTDDDEYILFDSWNSAIESTLVASKTEVFASIAPVLIVDNDTPINLPANLMSYLHSMAEAKCFALLQQQSNPKSEQREHKFRIRSQRAKWRQGHKLYSQGNYGRK